MLQSQVFVLSRRSMLRQHIHVLCTRFVLPAWLRFRPALEHDPAAMCYACIFVCCPHVRSGHLSLSSRKLRQQFHVLCVLMISLKHDNVSRVFRPVLGMLRQQFHVCCMHLIVLPSL